MKGNCQNQKAESLNENIIIVEEVMSNSELPDVCKRIFERAFRCEIYSTVFLIERESANFFRATDQNSFNNASLRLRETFTVDPSLIMR